MNAKEYRFKVEIDEENRLDKFLASKLPEISRSQIKSQIEKGNVTVDSVHIEKAGFKIVPGNVIEIIILDKETGGLIPEQGELDILHEDQNVIVLNKPSGIVVHPGAGNHSGTLVNLLLAHYPPIGEVGEADRPGVVHRLDKETSGVMVFAKNEKAYKWLVRQFKTREINKAYLALVDGHPPTPTGRIEAPIERDIKTRTRMSVGLRGQGKLAISEYFELQRFEDHTYLEVHPITGRTHQIRLHLNYLGVPVVGDTLYGRRNPTIDIDRFFLHAKSLTLKLPGDRTGRSFEAPLPEELKSILEALKRTGSKS